MYFLTLASATGSRGPMRFFFFFILFGVREFLLRFEALVAELGGGAPSGVAAGQMGGQTHTPSGASKHRICHRDQ